MPKATNFALTAQRLREVAHYDPLTGVFTWLVSLSSTGQKGNTFGGSPSGYKGKYRSVYIDKKTYYLHRLAFLYTTGEWPSEEIDHENTIGSDNRWDNLRPATSGQNKANRAAKGSTGVKGVSFSANRCKKPYEVTMGSGGAKWRLGYYDTIEEAHAAYVAEATRIHGEFARAA